jgi:hypothetical protein
MPSILAAFLTRFALANVSALVCMADETSKVFGIMMAYVVPGFIGLTGLVPVFPTIGEWLQPVNNASYGVGPTIYAILAAIAVGLILSCFRWLLLDQMHHWLGLRRPKWKGQGTADSMEAVNFYVLNHWKYYEFCGNTLIAATWSYLMHRLYQTSSLLSSGTDLGMVILFLVLLAASRDALRRYYHGIHDLFAQSPQKEGTVMFNGANHEGESSKAVKPSPNADKPDKSEVSKTSVQPKKPEAGEAKKG